MKGHSDTILKKLALLDKATVESLLEGNRISVIKNFTELSIQILEADFGFAWWKLDGNDKHELAYKSPTAPTNPTIPQKKESYQKKTKNLFFESNVGQENYESDISKYLKSYLIIPVRYGDHAYGSIVVCYKKSHKFTEQELSLSNIIGTIAAQAVTIPWLIENERQALKWAEKQKEIEILLRQEKIKTEFIENATHELRTPLAIMKGNIDLTLLNNEDRKSATNTLKAVNLEIKTLSEILNDMALITASEKSANKIIDRKPTRLPDLIEETVVRLKPIAYKKNIIIRIKKNKTSDMLVSGNKMYLEKLFLNLIKNAITYGRDNGRIDIELYQEKNISKIKITDNGIGISKEDLPKIFERFYRADKAHSGNHSGLGLAIAKSAVEIHEGTIQAKSVHGKGSTFTVSLPLIKAPTA